MGVMPTHVYLASGSPRRRFLLESAGFGVTVIRQHATEDWPSLPTHEAVEELARRKLKAAGQLSGPTIAADTTVVLGDVPLGKPASDEEACQMIRKLSGCRHEVITGVSVGDGCSTVSFAVGTEVWFRPLSDAEIRTYVAFGESHDKAGAYGIQGRGACLVDRIEGSYTNVVGLPLAETMAMLGAL